MGGFIGAFLGTFAISVIFLCVFTRRRRLFQSQKYFNFTTVWQALRIEGVWTGTVSSYQIPREIPCDSITLLNRIGGGVYSDVYMGRLAGICDFATESAVVIKVCVCFSVCFRSLFFVSVANMT